MRSFATMAQVTPHTLATTSAMLKTMGKPGEPCHVPVVPAEPLARTAANRTAGDPRCQHAPSHAAVCGPAPRRPDGANAPGNVKVKGMDMRAVKKNPLARTNNHVQR